MKRFKFIFSFLLIILILLLLISACQKYDDTDLRNKIESLDKRIVSLEDLVSDVNKSIVAIQTLIEGLNDALYVLSINEITDGYDILFSNGKSVTLKNGAPGHTPEIGARKDSDGVFYWVIDGEWLLNQDGEKQRVTGRDGDQGDDGITPQLKIEDGYWFVSIDNGKNWSKLGKATGEDGMSGNDGDSFFMSVTYDDYNVYVVLTDGTMFCFHRSGKDIPIIRANTLSSDLVLESFPYSNKFGDQYIFGCRVESFSGIKICKGYESYCANWFEIDESNVVLKIYESSTVVRETVAHGLKITRMLNVNINITAEGKAVLTMQTLGGSFTHTFDKWGYEANGVLTVKNDGSKLSNCYISATNIFFNHPVWIFGASYECVYNASWPGQLKNMGYFNYLLNGYPGRNGASTIDDIKKSLNYGKPQYLYYSGSNEITDEIYMTNLNIISSICKEKGITLIVYFRPDIPSRDNSNRRAAVIDVGCRYVNGELALHDPNKAWSLGQNTWYDGFLSSDNKHPTEMGAKALAMQFLCDFPEIMQFSGWERR